MGNIFCSYLFFYLFYFFLVVFHFQAGWFGLWVTASQLSVLHFHSSKTHNVDPSTVRPTDTARDLFCPPSARCVKESPFLHLSEEICNTAEAPSITKCNASGFIFIRCARDLIPLPNVYRPVVKWRFAGELASQRSKVLGNDLQAANWGYPWTWLRQREAERGREMTGLEENKGDRAAATHSLSIGLPPQGRGRVLWETAGESCRLNQGGGCSYVRPSDQNTHF